MSTRPRDIESRVEEEVRSAWIHILDLGVRRTVETARVTGRPANAGRIPAFATLP